MKAIHPLLRSTIAVVLGIVISFFVIVLAEGLNEKYFPSKHLTPTLEQMKAEVANLPVKAFLLILLGYVASSFFGAYAAARIAFDTHKLYAGMTVGFVLLLGGIVNFITIPTPIWLAVSACISFMLFAYIGSVIAKK